MAVLVPSLIGHKQLLNCPVGSRWNRPEVPSIDGDDDRYGFELQSGLPWSGYSYQPDFCSMSLIQEVVPEVLIVIPGSGTVNAVDVLKFVVVLIDVTGAETSKFRESES